MSERAERRIPPAAWLAAALLCIGAAGPAAPAPRSPGEGVGATPSVRERTDEPSLTPPAASAVVAEPGGSLPPAAPPIAGKDIEPLRILPHELREVTVGVVRDGPSWMLERLTDSVRRETEAVAKNEFSVSFREVPAFNADWKLERMETALKNALDDPEVDIVLAMGVLVTQAAANPDLDLKKPVVGGLILDADLVGFPMTESGVSGKRNFTFIVSSLRVANDLETLKRMMPLKRLHAVADGKLLEGTVNFHDALRRIGEKLGFPIIIVPAAERAGPILAGLEDAEAVYLTPLIGMSRAETQALINGINERKIPSFSMRGLPDVEKGVLAGTAPRTTQQLGRRIALNIQRINRGDPPESIPVSLSLKTEFVVNAETAAAIGYSPNFETLMSAEFLHREALEKGEPLDIREAMEFAARQNIDLAIRHAEVRGARQERNRAFSFLLPQVGGASGYERVDKDRAQASRGQLPEWRTGIGFEVSQILLNDETLSNWRSSKRTYRQRKYEEENLRLDIMELAAKRYLDLLSARTIQRIETENLRLTKSNLEVARTRYRVGAAGREEVYRWEAQLSRNKSSVLEAESAAESARVALNQTLGVEQERLWKAEDIVLADNDTHFLDNRLRKIIENAAQLDTFRRFAVEDAFRNSPALMAVGQAIEAQQIALNQRKRKFAVPTVDGVFSFDHTIERHRVSPPDTPVNDALFLPDRDDWFLGAVASLPLFEGGGRFFDVYRAKADLERLTGTRERLRQLIEQQTLTSIYNLESSHPNIALSRRAADAAHRNLEIVEDKYAQGLVSIIDLLDAQNQALVEDREAALAVYDYLKRLYEFQRAISWFQEFKTPEEEEAWIALLNDFMLGGK